MRWKRGCLFFMVCLVAVPLRAADVVWDTDRTISTDTVITASDTLILRNSIIVDFAAGVSLTVQGTVQSETGSSAVFRGLGGSEWEGVTVAGGYADLNNLTVRNARTGIHLDGSNNSKVVNCRVSEPVSSGSYAGIQVEASTSARIIGNTVNAGDKYLYGILAQDSQSGLFSGNNISSAQNDGLVLTGASRYNEILDNHVSNSWWQNIYVNSLSNNNTFMGNTTVGSSGVDIWHAYDNTFTGTTFDQGTNAFTFASYLSPGSPPSSRRYNHFENATVRNWQDGAATFWFWMPPGAPFREGWVHAFKMDNLSFQKGSTNLVFNGTGSDYTFTGSAGSEFPYVIIDRGNNGHMDLVPESSKSRAGTVYNMAELGLERRYSYIEEGTVYYNSFELPAGELNHDVGLLSGGSQTYNGVPFEIASGGNDAWLSSDGTSSVTVPVLKANPIAVYTLMNTINGEELSGTYASVVVRASDGSELTVELDPGQNLRDYEGAAAGWGGGLNDTINEITAFGALTQGWPWDETRVDMQEILLPVEWRDKILTSVTIQNWGADGSGMQNFFFAGLTIASSTTVIPEPSGAALLLIGLGCVLGLSWRNPKFAFRI